MTSKEIKGRFDCLSEKSETEENTFKKNANIFKKEKEGRFNFKFEKNNFEQHREKNNFEQHREYNNRNRKFGNSSREDTYNSFNRRRKNENEKKEEPKKEFKITENDFPAL